MAKNRQDIPFTECVERAAEIARVGDIDVDNSAKRVRGAVNDVHTRELAREEDWNFLVASSAITTRSDQTAGTVTINTGATSAIFSSDVSFDATVVGGFLKPAGNPNVYQITARNNATSLTISPALSEETNITNGAYTVFFPRYALADQFERFLKNGGPRLYQGGRVTVLEEKPVQDYWEDYRPSTTVPDGYRFVEPDTAGAQQIEITPPPNIVRVHPYDYIQSPAAMFETTGGTTTVDAGSTAVTFHANAGSASLNEAGTGWFFRVDAFGNGEDSEWYRVIRLNLGNSQAVLQTAFGVSGATSANYTLCAPQAYPVRLQPATMWGAARHLLADQNDPHFQFFDTKYRQVVDDGKRLYKTRIYNTEVETVFEDFNYRR